MTEVVVYGLLASGVVGGILYLGGRSLEHIGVVVGAIVALVVVFAVVAPRARDPVLGSRSASEVGTDQPTRDHSPGPSHRAGKRGRRRRR